MNASQVKSQLSQTDMLSILSDLGGEPYVEKDAIISRTICHNPNGGGSHKLYWYSETKLFRCFTECGDSFDLFELIQRNKGIEFNEAYKFVLDYFGIQEDGQVEYDELLDMSFFNKFNKQKIIYEPLRALDKSLLNKYDNSPHMSWIKDGILPSTMKKFDIKLSIADEQIIIPHYDIDDNLIGIRARNLRQDLVDNGKKYMPVFNGKRMLNHPTGANLYGLNLNMENILRMRKLILFESEKSVMQLDTIYNGYGIGVAVSGSSFSDRQLDLIKGLDIDEVIIAFDKFHDEVGDNEEIYHAKRIRESVANKLLPYFRVSVVWDLHNLIDKKDSPTDKGEEVFTQLYKERITL